MLEHQKLNGKFNFYVLLNHLINLCFPMFNFCCLQSLFKDGFIYQSKNNFTCMRQQGTLF